MRRFVLLVGLALAPVVVVLVLLAVFSIAGVTLWSRYANPGNSYDRAPEAMPVLRALERERVTFLRTQDWCQAYNDGSGVRSNTLRGTCTLTVGAADVFEPTTRARYDQLARLAADLPYEMNYVEVSYGADDRVAHAEISLATTFSRQSLVYQPGYSLSALRGAISPDVTVYTPINADWYHRLEDWN